MLCLHSRSSPVIFNALLNFVFKVEELCNGKLDNLVQAGLKFFFDSSVDSKVIQASVLASDTGMHVSRLLFLAKNSRKVFVDFCQKKLIAKYDTLQRLLRVYGNVPMIFSKLLAQ